MKKNFLKRIFLIGTMLVAIAMVAACKTNDNKDSSSSNQEPVYVLEGIADEWTMYCYEDITMEAVVLKDGLETEEIISWSSSDAAVASVDANGRIFAKKAGTVTITATSAGLTETCTITVLAPNGEPQLVVDSDEMIGMVYNSSYQLQPVVYYNGKVHKDMNLEYISENPTIATVDANGLIQGLALGETTITVSASWRGVSGAVLTESIAVKVDELVDIRFANADVNTIYTTNKDFGDGNVYQNSVEYVATVSLNEQLVTDGIVWKSSNEEVATVVDGVVTAVGAGETEIYVEYTTAANKVYTSEKIMLTVTLPVIEKDVELAFGAKDEVNELKASSIFDDGTSIVFIKDTTEFKEIEIAYANEKISGLVEDSALRNRTWVISNGEYAYKINVLMATNVIRQASDLGKLFNYSVGEDYYSVGTAKDAYYVLDGNVDASGYTHTHGKADSSGQGFRGTFDGRGYAIDGITFTDAGLFGYVQGGTIKNVALTNVKMQGTNKTEVYVITKQSSGMIIDNVFISVEYNSASWNQGLFEKAWGNASLSNVMVVATGGNANAFALGAMWNNETKYSYNNVYVISALGAVRVGSPDGITIYADVDTFKANITTSDLTNFNEYWDLSKDYPMFKTKKD